MSDLLLTYFRKRKEWRCNSVIECNAVGFTPALGWGGGWGAKLKSCEDSTIIISIL
jgi:hypothetical protein